MLGNYNVVIGSFEDEKVSWRMYICEVTKLGMKSIIYGWMQLKRLNGRASTFVSLLKYHKRHLTSKNVALHRLQLN